MKRLAIVLFSAIAAFGLAGTASAANAPAQAVQVTVEGKAANFGKNMVIVKGKTYVEYSALFKQLGYGWDLFEQIVYAEKEDVVIEAPVDGDIAIVNGRTVPSTGEWMSKDGRTYISLRLAGELTNHKVEWNGKTKTISLAFQGPTEEEKTAIHVLLSKLLLIEASNDPTGITSLLSDDTVMDAESVRENFKNIKTKTSYLDVKIQSFNDKTAVVIAIEDTKKVSGDFYPDNLSQVRYTLHKDAAGDWKIYDVETLGMEYTDIPGMFKQAAKIPEADRAAIGKAFEDQAKAVNDKNADAYVATLVDFPQKEQLKASLAEMFKMSTFNVTSEQWTVVRYDGANSAALLISMVSEVETSGQKDKSRSIVFNEAKKVDGKWLLDANAIVISSEEL
ncbi:copper amine oxidase N-terminal domain-containing protein [Cohnella terricola]|uniref:copper amine oxidase N-terminal domain-containing protein n=1 Tax=Cohnella terricola TaxID=1289167 RepID=UPI0016444D8D|nr:copper amine oxidase N-terminal domain-containing protein [Cohnella terricola]